MKNQGSALNQRSGDDRINDVADCVHCTGEHPITDVVDHPVVASPSWAKRSEPRHRPVIEPRILSDFADSMLKTLINSDGKLQRSIPRLFPGNSHISLLLKVGSDLLVRAPTGVDHP